MYLLSDEETEVVYERMAREHLHNPGLAAELLDHVCCVMETAMEQGADFEAAYQQACQAVSPNGFREIEEEVFFLLTFHKQLNMKRILFTSGFITTFLLSFGSLFKLMHWPMATYILLTGFAALLLTLAGLGVYSFRMAGTLPASYRIRTAAGLLSGLLLTAGSMFKILHYPGASIMLALGMVILNLIFLPMFFYQLYKKSIA